MLAGDASPKGCMMEKKESLLNVPSDVIGESRAAEIKKTFIPMANMLEKFEKAFEMVKTEAEEKITAEVCHTAKRLRLNIRQVRLDAEKNRVKQKERCLMEGQAIDSVCKILKYAVTEKEEQLKEIETHFEREEENRVKKIQEERMLELSRYDVAGSSLDLGNMDQLVWDNFLEGARVQWENRKEAERKAEEQRIESERKVRQFRERRDTLLPYSSYGSIDLLTEDTPEHLYQTLLTDLKNRKIKDDDEKERIRKENEKLVKENEEREAREKEEKQAREDKADIFVEQLLENGYVQKAKGVYYLGVYRVDRDSLLTLSEQEFIERLEETVRLERERIEREEELQKEKDRLEKEKKEADQREEKRLKKIKDQENRLKAEKKAREDEEQRIADEKTESARIALMASDPEKLFKIVESLKSSKENLSSEEAKSIIADCIQKITAASIRMENEIKQKT